MKELTREDLINRLVEFDEEAYLRYADTNQGERFHIVVVGGGALLLSGMILRATHDMDAIDISPELRKFMEAYDINTYVSAHMDTFAASYPDRVQPLPIPGRIIDFYSVALEDIIIGKLCAYRDHDIADITMPRVLGAVNWELLHDLAYSEDGVKGSMLNERRYQEFLFRFQEYERMYRPCES